MTIDSLRNFGANVDEGLERCMGKEAFYLEMVKLGLSDENFELTGQALEKGDLDQGFEHVHALKGIIGNLALSPLYATICELTEHLRAREDMDYMPLYHKLIEQRDTLRNGD